MAQYELNLRDYWQILRKQRRTIALTSILVAIAAFGLSEVLKPAPLYEATASVKFDRSSSMTGLFIEMMTYSYADDIASQTEVVKSYPVVEAAAKAAGLIPAGTDSDTIKHNPILLKTVLDLQRRLKVEREGNTNIIRVTVTAEQAAEAERLANAVVAAYRQENIYDRNRQVADATDFIQKQLTVVGEQLQAAEQAVEHFKTTEGIVELSEEAKAALTELTRVEADHSKAIRTLDEIDEQLGQLQREGHLGAGPALLGDPSRIFTEEAAAQIFMLNTRLMELQQERETLLISYRPEHPQVKELDEKVKVVRSEMAKELSAKRSTYESRKEQLAERLRTFQGQYHRVPEKALRLARMEREVKIDNDIYSLLKSKHQEALIKGAEKIIEVTPLQPAFAAMVPINAPHTGLNVLVGALIGCLLGVIIGIVQESFDTSLGTIEDVESFLGLPVLGVLPQAGPDVMQSSEPEGAAPAMTLMAWVGWAGRHLLPGKNHRPSSTGQARHGDRTDRGRSAADLASLYAPKSALAESYRSLRTNLLFTALGKPLQVIQFTSVGIGEGKTSVVVNTALSMAQAGKRVLVIDADLRRPAIHQVFGIDKSPGLTELLLGTKTFPQVCRSLPDLLMGRFQVEEVMALPGIDKLNIITSGFLPPNPSECLNSARFDELMTQLKQEYDLIIFDVPPILPVADSIIMGRKADGTLLVYQVGDIPRVALRRAKMILEQAQVKVLGIVLNNIRAEISMDSYQFDYHYPYFASGPTETATGPAKAAGRH